MFPPHTHTNLLEALHVLRVKMTKRDKPSSCKLKF